MPETAKPEWIASQRGESYQLILRKGVLVLDVFREAQSRDNPSPFPYAVKVFDGRLAEVFGTADAAKAAALRAAKKFLNEASASLAAIEENK